VTPTAPTPSPIFDAERLRALRQVSIDDTRLEESLSDVVRQVGQLFETTVCFINLVYLERQVFRAWFGSVPDELMRAGNTHDQSLCTYVVEESAPLIIQDLLDSATWHEPFDWPSRILNFYSPLGVRFYAGLPLVTSAGHTLGTLCLIDMKPRRMEAAALESLQFFAAKAAAELELASQNETARRLRNELEKASRFATALSDLLFRLQNLADVPRVCDAGLGMVRDAAALDYAALLTIDPATAISASVGELPPLLPDVGEIMETQYFDGYAVVPLPVIAAGAPSLLMAGRAAAPWSEADRFFLQSASRLIGMNIQRCSRVNDLERAALTDDLTGVGNRRAFDLLAKQPLDPSERWLLFIGDLSGFKLLNDTMGHPVGDLCLQRVADALARSVRPEDRARIFRHGGDEFAMIVTAGSADANALRNRFERAAAVALKDFGGLNLRLDLGVVQIPDEATSVVEAVALADSRMYERKRRLVGDGLSDRERQVMMMIIDGKRMKEIALDLGISETTVATHRARLLRKMNLRDNRDLFRYALRRGLIN
jgi:diguanylate cyclase (GGDEF)-like protein